MIGSKRLKGLQVSRGFTIGSKIPTTHSLLKGFVPDKLMVIEIMLEISCEFFSHFSAKQVRSKWFF